MRYPLPRLGPAVVLCLAGALGRSTWLSGSRKRSRQQAAASSKSQAQAMGANPAADAAAVTTKAAEAADKQAEADKLREKRTIIFWAIASICGLGISGGFGFFLLQSVSTTPVNSFLDLAITGL